MKKTGWIGLGNMGTPMAKNLEKAGFELSVYNRSKDKAEAFSGTSEICGSIAELVRNCDIVFTMVTNDEAVKAVYDEILTLDISGKLFVDMSTISQKLSEETASKIRQKGGSFLDAPVAGSTKPAADGTLIVLVGGEKNDLETARPYFEKLGKLTKHFGANGKGIAAKLSINYFLSTVFLGLAEAALFAEQKGLDKADLLDAINESASGSGATRLKTPSLVNNEFPPAFALDLMLKDILLAQADGADFALTESLVDIYKKAQESGFGKLDVMAVIQQLRLGK